MISDSGAGIREELQEQASSFIEQNIKSHIRWFCAVVEPGEDSFPFRDDPFVQALYNSTGRSMPADDSLAGWRLLIIIKSYIEAEKPPPLPLVDETGSYAPSPYGHVEKGPYRLQVPIQYDENIYLTSDCKQSIRAVLAEFQLTYSATE